MSSSTYSTTRSETFTVTHAWHIAVKVGTDLKRMQRFYGAPGDPEIADYEKEFVALLKGNYLDKIEYGFRVPGGEWRVAVRYEARYGGVIIADNDPGRIRMGVDVAGCDFHSFLFTNLLWSSLTAQQRDRLYAEAEVGFRRTEGTEPDGRWTVDKVYSAGGRGVQRSSV